MSSAPKALSRTWWVARAHELHPVTPAAAMLVVAAWFTVVDLVPAVSWYARQATSWPGTYMLGGVTLVAVLLVAAMSLENHVGGARQRTTIDRVLMPGIFMVTFVGLGGGVVTGGFSGDAPNELAREARVTTVPSDVVARGAAAPHGAAVAALVEGAQSDAGAERSTRPVEVAGGRSCALMHDTGVGDPVVAVTCSDGTTTTQARFTSRFPGPQWVGPLDTAVGRLAPGHGTETSDAWGYIDTKGRPVMVLPVQQRRGLLAGRDLPAGAVLAVDGQRPRLVDGDDVPGPTVGRSVARSVTAAVVADRRLGVPVKGSRWPVQGWDGSRPVWITPVAARGTGRAVTSVVVMDARSGTGRAPSLVVHRLPERPAALDRVTELVSLLHADELAGDTPGQARVEPGGRWSVELAKGVVLVDRDLRTCVVPAGKTTCAPVAAGPPSRTAGPALGAPTEDEIATMGLDELIALRDRAQDELDGRLKSRGGA